VLATVEKALFAFEPTRRIVPTTSTRITAISWPVSSVQSFNGKQHRYFSVVENRRVGQNRTAQRTVLYLGEINDSQEATWRQTLEVFDESHQRYTTLSLFPEDREIPAESSNSIQVKLSEMELRRPRAFGNCWLGCELWLQLQLEQFWEEKLGEKV
jgi:hypothetical protein